MFSFYADESGTANIYDRREWYVFLAVGLDDDNWKAIDDSILALKRKYFKGWESHRVEIHSNAIRRAKLERYPPNPFSTLDESTLKSFTTDLYALIQDAPIVSRRVVYEPRSGEVGIQSVITAESLVV